MRFILLLSACLLISLSSCSNTAADDPAPVFSATVDADGILVIENDRPVLRYQKTVKSLDGKWPRANYVHPLYDLDGSVITEDFPDDHGHHRGIFWAWHQVFVGDQRMGDAWVCENFEWDVVSTTAVVNTDHVVLKTEVLWKSPALVNDSGDRIPIAREDTTVTVHSQQDDRRFVDFEIALQSLVEDVRIGGSEDEKGYGGFSPRLKLTDTTNFVGPAGAVAPILTGIDTGPWMDVVNAGEDVAGGGVAMISHPQNPGFPEPWILRQERSMQNAAWPGREPVALSKEQPTTLRYQLVIHRGSADSKLLKEWSGDFGRSGSVLPPGTE